MFIDPNPDPIHKKMEPIVRLKEAAPEPRDARQRKLWLGSGLFIALLLFLAGGGSAAFYLRTYIGVQAAGDAIQRVTEDKLPFLGSSRGSKYRLQGIIYSSRKPMAVVNQQACAPGERFSIPVGRETEVIECLDIDLESVEIKTSAGHSARLILGASSPKTP